MGVQYMAQNRERAKTLGGRELTLSEVKALRYVREHRRNPVPPEELGELDAEIGRMETANLLHDYDVLRMVNRVALVKLAIPTARLNRNEKLHLITWTETSVNVAGVSLRLSPEVGPEFVRRSPILDLAEEDLRPVAVS